MEMLTVLQTQHQVIKKVDFLTLYLRADSGGHSGLYQIGAGGTIQIYDMIFCEINKFFSCHVSLPCFLILLIIPHCAFIRKGDDLTLYGCAKSQNMINFMWIK